MADPHELPPLADDILALLEEAKPIAPLDPAIQAALLGRIGARVTVSPSGGGGTGGSAAGAPGALATTGRAAIGIALAIGAVAGAALDHAIVLASAPAPTVSVAVAVSQPPPVIASVAPPVVVAAPASAAVSLPSKPLASPAISSRGLAAERGILDVARAALAQGDAGDALAAAERHAHDYPEGALLEEREAIAIKALVALGRGPEARARAASFEKRFPNGLLLRSVKASVDGAP